MVSSFKKDRSKIRIINCYWQLLVVEKGIKGGIFHAINQYEKANNKYMKDYDKMKES